MHTAFIVTCRRLGDTAAWLMVAFMMVAWSGRAYAQHRWSTYPTYPDYEKMMEQFATGHPEMCEIITLGTLPSNRKVMVAHINDGSAKPKPKFLIVGAIHGDETTGWMLSLQLIDYILANPAAPECQRVLEDIDLYVCPNMNPDGTYHTSNYTLNGARRTNANTVDLNRNFPNPHGNVQPDGKSYELETQWMMQFTKEHLFTMAALYHGGTEVFNYPWDGTKELHADDEWFQLIAHEYTDLVHQQNSMYMTRFNDGVTNGAQWEVINGGMQDYMTGCTQSRAVTIECSTKKKPNASEMPTYWLYNKEGIFALMTQCCYGIHGTVADKDTLEPLEATVTVNGHDDAYSTVTSHLPAGDFHRPIKGGTYTVTFQAEGYLEHEATVTVDDGETVNLEVMLESIDGWHDAESAIGSTTIAANASAKDTWYTLDGRRLTGPQTRKGIYVHGGRKVVVR